MALPVYKYNILAKRDISFCMFIQKEMPLFQQELIFGTFSFTFSMSDSESVPWEVPESDP